MCRDYNPRLKIFFPGETGSQLFNPRGPRVNGDFRGEFLKCKKWQLIQRNIKRCHVSIVTNTCLELFKDLFIPNIRVAFSSSLPANLNSEQNFSCEILIKLLTNRKWGSSSRKFWKLSALRAFLEHLQQFLKHNISSKICYFYLVYTFASY